MHIPEFRQLLLQSLGGCNHCFKCVIRHHKIQLIVSFLFRLTRGSKHTHWRTKPRKLSLPVDHHGFGHQDQVSEQQFRVGIFDLGQKTNGFQCLPESHFIRYDAVCFGSLQGGQPVQTLDLLISHRHYYWFRLSYYVKFFLFLFFVFHCLVVFFIFGYFWLSNFFFFFATCIQSIWN